MKKSILQHNYDSLRKVVPNILDGKNNYIEYYRQGGRKHIVFIMPHKDNILLYGVFSEVKRNNLIVEDRYAIEYNNELKIARVCICEIIPNPNIRHDMIWANLSGNLEEALKGEINFYDCSIDFKTEAEYNKMNEGIIEEKQRNEYNANSILYAKLNNLSTAYKRSPQFFHINPMNDEMKNKLFLSGRFQLKE